MTNTVLVGTTDAGDPYVRFYGGKVASAKLGRGALRYKLSRFVFGLICCAMMICLFGCSEDESFITPPPLTITFRESLLDSTRVMQLTNRSGSESLVAQVQVRNKTTGEKKTHILKIAPGATEELGRLEMAWVFEPGEKFDVKCDGYWRTFSGRVP